MAGRANTKGDEAESPRVSQPAATGEHAEEVPEAELWPSRSEREAPSAVEITVYIVTGRHGGLTVPEQFCRECNLFVRAADRAADRVDTDAEVRVVSWWTNLLSALRHGGYHPPVLVVGGERVCQGHDVPTTADVVDAVRRTTES